MPLLNKAPGLLLLLSFALTVISVWTSVNIDWIQGGLMWLAGSILFFSLGVKQKRVILTISLFAILSWVVAWITGETSQIIKALSANQLMIVMLIGVQFLQLVALPQMRGLNRCQRALKPLLERTLVCTFLVLLLIYQRFYWLRIA